MQKDRASKDAQTVDPEARRRRSLRRRRAFIFHCISQEFLVLRCIPSPSDDATEKRAGLLHFFLKFGT